MEAKRLTTLQRLAIKCCRLRENPLADKMVGVRTIASYGPYLMDRKFKRCEVAKIVLAGLNKDQRRELMQHGPLRVAYLTLTFGGSLVLLALLSDFQIIDSQMEVIIVSVAGLCLTGSVDRWYIYRVAKWLAETDVARKHGFGAKVLSSII